MLSPEQRKIWYSRLPWILAIASAFNALALLYRMLWFDEVLTAGLLLKLPLHHIYFAYEIPNNHIVFTLIEKIWIEFIRFFFPYVHFYLRLVPLACGTAAIFLLTKKMIRSCGLIAGAFVTFFFVCSSVWEIYATAIRGYMTGFLFTVLALFCCGKLLKQGKGFYFFYFLISLLNAGTTPTNLAALAAVSLYYLPYAYRNKKMGRWYWSCAAPLLALLVFYLPILEKFIGCMKLGEGWWSRTNAVKVLYTGAGFPLAILIVFCLTGAYILWSKYPHFRLNVICWIGIVLMPMIPFFLFKVPPFPRVFFPMTAVWLLLAGHCFNAWCRTFRKWRFMILLPLLLQAVFTLGFFQDRAVFAANYLYGDSGDGDDYIAPYYARTDFEPHKVLQYLNMKFRAGENLRAFATFNADAPSLQYAAMSMDISDEILLIDTLNRPKILRLQDHPGTKYIIARSEDDLKEALNRFGYHNAVLEKAFGPQKIYRILY